MESPSGGEVAVDPRLEAVDTIIAIDAVWGAGFQDAPLEVVHEWNEARATLEAASAAIVTETQGHHDEELPGWLEYALRKGVEV
ncbi:MAG: hypothetical protein ACXWLH_02630 [Candidatus Saccharimonadales bacterium]